MTAEKEYFIECVRETIEDEKCSVLEAIDITLEDCLRDLFNMGRWDEPDTYEKIINIDGKSYCICIEEDGCCEATHDHRIMYWTHSVKEVPYVEEKKYPKLNFETEVIRKIYVDELEDFITKIYGHKPEIMANQEWDWNCWYDISAKKDKRRSDWEEKELNDFINNGNTCYGTIYHIMNDLADKGAIEEGNYQVMEEH